MRESRTYGSVRGALSNERPYRVRCYFAATHMAAIGPARQAAFFGPIVANGALRTWLDLQLDSPCRD